MPRPVIVSDIAELVDGTGDPAFAVSAGHTIIAWNHAAENLLGYRHDEVLGRSCAQVIGGTDGDGHIVCTGHCPFLVALRRGERLRSFDLQVRRRNGAPVWVGMTSLVVGAGEPCVVHIMRDVTEERNRRAFVRQVLQSASALEADPPAQTGDGAVILSPRETEILRLLAAGSGTKAIAETLSISPATVRNHVQRIMLSLQAHSRLEAVIKALQRDLI